jgi:hypothetical protein
MKELLCILEDLDWMVNKFEHKARLIYALTTKIIIR